MQEEHQVQEEHFCVVALNIKTDCPRGHRKKQINTFSYLGDITSGSISSTGFWVTLHHTQHWQVCLLLFMHHSCKRQPLKRINDISQL